MIDNYILNGYVPKIYNGVLEMDELISTEQYAFNDVHSYTEQVQNNAFVSTSDIYRVREYENMLNITPITNDLSERKENIIDKMYKKPNYTKEWLKELLDTKIGENEYKLIINYDNYLVYIRAFDITDELYNELYNTIKNAIPANIQFEFVVSQYTTWAELQNYTWAELQSYTWEELQNIE